jgi:hypothetical protein
MLDVLPIKQAFAKIPSFGGRAVKFSFLNNKD